MKIQSLAVIFIIIILPISIIVSSYTQNQITTLRLQISYDNKLDNATYDAVKAFQLNTVNSSSSSYANSKMRDIEASANTFFNSVATNFNMAGYNSDILKEYVPALVYTMYDGYYIYSPYINTLDEETKGRLDGVDTKYKDGDKITGLKPYIYYSARYKKGNIDVVITYALDNYVTIQGTIGSEVVSQAGYVMDNIERLEYDANNKIEKLTYRGQEITKEKMLSEKVGNKIYEYIKINGVKYYKDSDGTWFSIFNGEKLKQESLGNIKSNDSALRLYEEAYNLKKFIQSNGLNNLSADDAVDVDTIYDENGNEVYNFKKETGKIFDYDKTAGKSIEDQDSDFNQHRLAVIRYTIEKNLSIAIANYNNYVNSAKTNFQMPRLKEDEWEKILNNISVISFLQGLNIGGKIYNGYSIINNNKNEEVVTENSIYIATDDGYYHVPTEDKLEAKNIVEGILNIDIERKSIIDTQINNYPENNGTIRYYYPKKYYACYNCIVNKEKINNTDNIYKYLEGKGNLTKTYYTTLARERYSMYKITRNSIEFKKQFMEF